MWRMFKDELAESWHSFRGACLTGLAAIFGKRTHDGRVITFAGQRWFPKNLP